MFISFCAKRQWCTGDWPDLDLTEVEIQENSKSICITICKQLFSTVKFLIKTQVLWQVMKFLHTDQDVNQMNWSSETWSNSNNINSTFFEEPEKLRTNMYKYLSSNENTKTIEPYLNFCHGVKSLFSTLWYLFYSESCNILYIFTVLQWTNFPSPQELLKYMRWNNSIINKLLRQQSARLVTFRIRLYNARHYKEICTFVYNYEYWSSNNMYNSLAWNFGFTCIFCQIVTLFQ